MFLTRNSDSIGTKGKTHMCVLVLGSQQEEHGDRQLLE